MVDDTAALLDTHDASHVCYTHHARIYKSKESNANSILPPLAAAAAPLHLPLEVEY
jgi:hypothetical protein